MGISKELYSSLESGEHDFLHLPEAPVDLHAELTGECAFKCPNCWGPRHRTGGGLSAKRWIEIFQEFHWLNTSDVVLTGGDPLEYDGVLEVATGVRNEGMRLTLSVTGVDQKGILPDLFDVAHEVGIPLDATSPDANSLWRRSRKFGDGGMEQALSALRLATSDRYRGLDVTLRTVAMAHNIGELALMPEFLINNGVDISKVRWKIYELMTNIGPRKGRSLQFYTESEAAIMQLTEKNTGFKTIQYKRAEDSSFDYFIIGPGGDARIIIASPNGPIDLGLGNVISDFKGVVERLNIDYDTYLARMSPGAYVNLSNFFEELRDPDADTEKVLEMIEDGTLKY